MSGQNISETTDEKVINELQKVEHELVDAVAAERRAEVDIEKAEHHLEKIEEELVRESHIIVNGRTRTVEGRIVSYEEAVKLAFPSGPTRPDIRYTVTYRNAVKPHHMGELDVGQRVTVKHGKNPLEETVFNVTETVLS